MFEPFNLDGVNPGSADNKAIDEWTLSQQLGSNLSNAMREHYDTFIVRRPPLLGRRRRSHSESFELTFVSLLPSLPPSLDVSPPSSSSFHTHIHIRRPRRTLPRSPAPASTGSASRSAGGPSRRGRASRSSPASPGSVRPVSPASSALLAPLTMTRDSELILFPHSAHRYPQGDRLGAQVRPAHQPRLPRRARVAERLQPLGQAGLDQPPQRRHGPRQRPAHARLHPHRDRVHQPARVQERRAHVQRPQRAVRQHDRRRPAAVLVRPPPPYLFSLSLSRSSSC